MLVEQKLRKVMFVKSTTQKFCHYAAAQVRKAGNLLLAQASCHGCLG